MALLHSQTQGHNYNKNNISVQILLGMFSFMLTSFILNSFYGII